MKEKLSRFDLPEGPISHGTTLQDDIFSSIIDFLDCHYAKLEGNLKDRITEIAEEWQELENGEKVIKDDLLQDLNDIMNEIAPDGYYFGSAEGDPTYIGFFLEQN